MLKPRRAEPAAWKGRPGDPERVEPEPTESRQPQHDANPWVLPLTGQAVSCVPRLCEPCSAAQYSSVTRTYAES